MVCLPGREEHGQAGNQGREDPFSGVTETYGCSLAQAGQGAVEGVDAMASYYQ